MEIAYRLKNVVLEVVTWVFSYGTELRQTYLRCLTTIMNACFHIWVLDVN
jgi:hypothetical protein